MSRKKSDSSLVDLAIRKLTYFFTILCLIVGHAAEAHCNSTLRVQGPNSHTNSELHHYELVITHSFLIIPIPVAHPRKCAN